MKLIKEFPARARGAQFDGLVSIDTSVCYDFIASLRALLNPRTFKRTRRWAAEQLPNLGEENIAKARFLFEGFDTALGYGASRVVKELQPGADPTDLIEAIAEMAPERLAMFMLDTGETSPERLDRFRAVLNGDTSQTKAGLEGLPAGWASRCRRVLLEPASVQSDLVTVLAAHRSQIYAQHLDAVITALTDAGVAARDLMAVLPPAAAVEHLTGGYTISPDLEVDMVTLAPSVFIAPYMSARVDEAEKDALIIYGVKSSVFDEYEPVQAHSELEAGLKAVADPSRLMLLRLLRRQPMYTSELVAHLKLGQPTVHHHLTQLRTAGLVRQERDRIGMKYSIRHEAATELIDALHDWLLEPNEDETSSPSDLS